MLLNELFEAETKHVTFCFGRMNPPTIGHKQVLDTMKSQGGDIKIFVNQSQDAKKNPLDYGTKIKFIKEMFPEYANNVVDDAGLNTIVKVASYLHDQGYTAATFVAGSDRLEDMKKLLEAYNGVEGKSHGYYKFEVLDFVSSGEREDGAEGVAGVSASGARAAAANNDFEAFKEATGAGELAKPLFAAVRKGMKISEDIEEGIKSKIAGAALAAANLLGTPAQAAEEPVKPITIAHVIIDGEVRKYNLGDKFSSAREAEEFITNILNKQGLQGYQLEIKHGYPKKKEVKEAPIEMDPADPMDPMIYGAGGNPAKLKYRMLRAANQFKDIAARVDKASPGEWQTIAKQFEELKMNVEQIRHALEELGKMRKKGGIRSRGIDPMLDDINEGYGRYWCSTDKKWKTRKGPKQKRSS